MVRLPSVRLATRRFILSSLAMAIVLGLALGAPPAWAEFQIGGYGGWSESFDSDIHLSQPGGTNLTLNDVPWESKSFHPPPYWGVTRHLLARQRSELGPHGRLQPRQGHRRPGRRGERHRVPGTASSSGPRIGSATPSRSWSSPTASMRSFFGGSISLDVRSLDALCRCRRRLRLPACGGAPRAWTAQSAHTFDYQVTGVAVEGLVGLEYHLTQRFSLFGDYKLSYSNNDADLKDGGHASDRRRDQPFHLRRVLPLRRRSCAGGLRSL